MNSCVLMVEIVGDAQMRQTQEGLSVTDVLVEFEGNRETDPPNQIKLVGWGSLAEEIKHNYQKGDRIIVDGRLGMNLVEIDGYKEKKAELVASRIYPFGSSGFSSNPPPKTEAQPSLSAPERSPEVVSAPTPVAASPTVTATVSRDTDVADDTPDGDWDEIPFVRPVYSKTNYGSQLCDSWELEANQYWERIK